MGWGPMAKGYGWAAAVALAAACGGDKPTGTSNPGTGDDDDTDTLIATGLPESGTVSDSRPAFDCYADMTRDDNRDGTTDGSGWDGYDAASPTFILYTERDNNGNGSPEQFATWTRDAAGHTLRYEATGQSTWSYDATYDVDGNRLTYEEDSDGDGDVDFIEGYGYENSLLVHYEVDDDANGALDYVLDYQRDPDGNRRSAEEDIDGDGAVDVWYTYTLDAADRDLHLDVDEGNDGVIESAIDYVYTDVALRIGSSTVDDLVDGVIDFATSFSYDENGRELYYAEDWDVDAGFEYQRTIVRDDDGRITSYTMEAEEDVYGYPVTLVQTQSYDALGRLVSIDIEVTDLGSNQVTYEASYAYLFGGTCP